MTGGVAARIPKERYVSREFMQLEWERLWTRVWLLAGHASMLPRAGSFFTTEIGAEGLLLVRESERRVRAFYNVCQHRGARLCAAERGDTASFRCPYHHWEYGRDGALQRAPLAASFPAGLDGIRLAELRCELCAGFVWVTMSPEAEPLRDFLAPVLPHLDRYRPDDHRLTHDITVEIACNWKTSADVSNEAYHLRSVHPELLALVDDTRVTLEELGLHSRITVPIGAPAPGTPFEGRLTPALRGLMQRLGVEPAPFEGDLAGARAAMIEAVRRRAISERLDLSALSDAQLIDKHQLYIFPNVQLNFTATTLELYRHRPHPSDPQIMLFDEQAYARVPAAHAGPPPPRRRCLKHGEADLGPVMGADVDLLPTLQRGMASRGFAGLLLCDREGAIRAMHRGLDHYLFGAPRPEAP